MNSLASHEWHGDRYPVHDRVAELEAENAALREELKTAVAAEREACAVVCDNMPVGDKYGGWFNDDMSEGAMSCAEAIRARGDQDASR